MTSFINTIKTKIESITEIDYTDVNWGQIDYYKDHVTASWPRVLLDLENGVFEDLGVSHAFKKNADNTEIKAIEQDATSQIAITIAHFIGENPDAQSQAEAIPTIFNIENQIFGKIHRLKNVNENGTLLRTAIEKLDREDGVIAYKVTYILNHISHYEPENDWHTVTTSINNVTIDYNGQTIED